MHWQIGDTKITKIQEIVYDEFPDVIPAATPEVVGKVGWISPFVTPGNVLTLSIHTPGSWTRPGRPSWSIPASATAATATRCDVMSRLATTYLDDMQAAGYDPDGVDYVLCTHLHLDHVGWNTHEVNGKWVPTFPNAKYLMDQNELDLFGKIDDKMIDGLPGGRQGLLPDSAARVRGFHAAGHRRRPDAARQGRLRGIGPGLRRRPAHPDARPHPGPLLGHRGVPGRERDDHRRLHPPSHSSSTTRTWGRRSTSTARRPKRPATASSTNTRGRRR